MQCATPPVLSAITAIVSDADQHELSCDGEIVDMADLRQVWAHIPDPRDRRGRRHSLGLLLALVQAAIVSGATSYAAIRHWVARAPREVLAQLGARQDRRTGHYQAPHPDTVCRTIAQVNAASVDAAYAAHRASQLADLYDDPDELIPMTVDGKTQRGTAHGEAPARHRLGALLAEDGIMVATLDVGTKSNEITAFAPLLDQIPHVKNVVISADMLHCQRKHAHYLHRRGAFYLFPVGGNQPGLFDQLDALAWKDTPIEWTTYDRGHGRTEIRTIQVRPAPPGTRFPHVKQVFLLERHVYDLHWKPLSSVAVLGVTNLTATHAGPRRLAELVRGEWSIENKDHYVRDVALGEDRCRVRTASAPSILATMRSYAIGALRLLNHTNIAEGTRWARDDFMHPLIALGLTM
ncbi:ISAs1 family transposase [Acrocarpospora corrugata]|uniref:ISAs1 family transposase n=2 Tax=Acrocarpospora corrugata TaxID=35763 RepID=UPI001FE2F6AD|nr:ISAs1 family transposase [Acrocarpospora corrugata]